MNKLGLISILAISMNVDSAASALQPLDEASDSEKLITDYLPLIKTQPIYPKKALWKKICGYVVTSFTVTKEGRVKDIKVIESEPPEIFDKAAIYVVKKYLYNPRKVDGVPVDTPNVTFRSEFDLKKCRNK